MEFGCRPIDPTLFDHPFAGTIFNLQRNLDELMSSGRKFYIYTGRGPSSDSLHAGHLIPFIFTKYLQDKYHCPVVIQITDDEKFMRDKHLTFEQVTHFADENIKDILSLGFQPELTTIIRDSQYKFPRDIERLIPIHVMKKLFGFTSETSVGEFVFPAKEIMLAFGKYVGFDGMNCLIVAGVEQDPYFRYAIDLAKKLNLPPPAVVYGTLIPGVDGSEKMSASRPESCIYIHEPIEDIERKLNGYDEKIRNVLKKALMMIGDVK